MQAHLHFPVWTSASVICRTWEGVEGEEEEEEDRRVGRKIPLKSHFQHPVC